jgi:hypothetical protein
MYADMKRDLAYVGFALHGTFVAQLHVAWQLTT